jgi:hypothetical protein
VQNSIPNKTERERKENAKQSVEIDIERKREIIAQQLGGKRERERKHRTKRT